MEQLRKWVDQHKRNKDNVAREEQTQFETKLFETRMKFETELASAKVETPTTKTERKTGETLAKLPKLVILRLSGYFQDWQRFWKQFTETVEKTSMSPITKFTYLCELLDPKIKHNIDSLPFTAEGYNRAKSILQDRYGKESEIIKSYVKDIMNLPYIPNANPRKMKDFSEQLNHCVQALQTIIKLSQVDGNVSMTLDKLPRIRGDLVRTVIRTGKNAPLPSYLKQSVSDEEKPLLTKIAHTEIKIDMPVQESSMPSHESVFIVVTSHTKQGAALKSPTCLNGNKFCLKSGCALTVELEAIVQPSVRARVRVRNVENDITPPSAKRHQPRVRKRP